MIKEQSSLGQVLPSKNYKRTPWKNGRGFSSEIAIYPPEAEFPSEPFLWRLSTAEVTSDGPFSTFEGYRRFITLVSDNSLLLNVGLSPAPIEVQKSKVVEFSGDEKTSCTLPSGAVQDLNLVFRQDKVKAEFKRIELKGKPRSFRAEGKTVLIVSVSGSFTASIYPNEEKFTVHEMETLRYQLDQIPPGAEYLFLLEPKTPSCSLVWVELDYELVRFN